MSDDQRWIDEATRLFRRYEVEIVAEYGLCPWAEPARRAGNVRERVILQTNEDTAPGVAAIHELAADDDAEVAVLIFPRINVLPPVFDRFVSRLRDADACTHALGEIPFAMAAFHPDSPIDSRAPERLIPFLRRTPDPTIQIVRTRALDRVRNGAPQGTHFVSLATFDIASLPAPTPPLRERIARANIGTIERVGIAEVTRRLDDIRNDRRRAYAELSERL